MRVRRAFVPVVLLALAACSSAPPPAVRPMRVVGHRPGDVRTSDRLLVLLPGRASTPEDFRQSGFLAEIARAAAPFDVAAVDAHGGYYVDGRFIEILAEDVLLPARRDGYREVWLVGISMGGVGSLATVLRRPELVDGAILLAPFLGSHHVIERVRRHGAALPAIPRPIDGVETWFEELWIELLARDPGKAPPIFLGFGRDDRYAEGQRLLGTLLPAERVVEVDGGHDWRAWKRAIAELVPRTPIAR